MAWPDWFTDRDFTDLLAVNNFSLYKMFSGEEIHKLTAGEITEFLGGKTLSESED